MGKIKENVKLFLKTPIGWAFILAVMYFVMLYPASSFFGWILFPIFGWIIPDLFNFCISYGIANKLGSNSIVKKVLIFISASVLLTILPNMSAIKDYAFAKR